MKSAHYWEEARCALLFDPFLKEIINDRPGMKLTGRGTAFATLARAIVGQQISVKAAQSVWKRVCTQCERPTAKNVLKQSPEALRACGLSQMKVGYLRDLARHFDDGLIKPRRFRTMSDEAIITALVDVKGIGRWSAEMFLMFHLLRPDVWPVDDLGLRKAIDRAWPKKRARTRADYIALGDRFAPWRSVACWYLWRSIEPVPDDY